MPNQNTKRAAAFLFEMEDGYLQDLLQQLDDIVHVSGYVFDGAIVYMKGPSTVDDLQQRRGELNGNGAMRAVIKPWWPL